MATELLGRSGYWVIGIDFRASFESKARLIGDAKQQLGIWVDMVRESELRK